MERMFRNKNGYMQDRLRLKDGEDLKAAIDRLRAAGWEIPDASELEITSDTGGPIMKLKGGA